ncbi:MAG TPA: hypothetical protein PK207_07845 [Candidatus Aminicenantes bacterium]|nr:hypothetical protein [Acidobacteriota bacterium]HOF83312.1 hypothetical protein [Candidatus Aminicenantes bacterium]HOS11595.1 hypothetical protein [Candidatus Aminicenantes bacterium]HOU48768.1 hypothetical protein [Candidatus Aminicenantes bacterium]HPL14100.1 hypothetical protein [Candidatus Aminicenantes bacterium]
MKHRRKFPVLIVMFLPLAIPAVFFGQETVKVTAMYFETRPTIVTVTSSVSDGPEGLSAKTERSTGRRCGWKNKKVPLKVKTTGGTRSSGS